MARIVRTSSAPGSRRVAAGQKHKRGDTPLNLKSRFL